VQKGVAVFMRAYGSPATSARSSATSASSEVTKPSSSAILAGQGSILGLQPTDFLLPSIFKKWYLVDYSTRQSQTSSAVAHAQ
jgi:hypothetical protein